MNQQIISNLGQGREGHPILYLKGLKQLLEKIEDVQKNKIYMKNSRISKGNGLYQPTIPRTYLVQVNQEQ